MPLQNMYFARSLSFSLSLSLTLSLLVTYLCIYFYHLFLSFIYSNIHFSFYLMKTISFTRYTIMTFLTTISPIKGHIAHITAGVSLTKGTID